MDDRNPVGVREDQGCDAAQKGGGDRNHGTLQPGGLHRACVPDGRASMEALLAEAVIWSPTGRQHKDLPTGWENLPADWSSLYPYSGADRATDCHSPTGAAAVGDFAQMIFIQNQTNQILTAQNSKIEEADFRRCGSTQRVYAEDESKHDVSEEEFKSHRGNEQTKKSNEGEGNRKLPRQPDTDKCRHRLVDCSR